MTHAFPLVSRTAAATELCELAGQLAEELMDPVVDEYERNALYPEGLFAKIGELGLLGLPFDEEIGGAGVSYEVYLQVLEEVARHWASVAVALSVHTMSTMAVVRHGSSEQKAQLLPGLLERRTIAGYSLSEPQAGSDVAALACRAQRDEDLYRITGEKAWITHGGRARQLAS